MKKTPEKKKLTLKKQTLKKLKDSQLDAVKGGQLVVGGPVIACDPWSNSAAAGCDVWSNSRAP